jgi:hypothetical protein
MAKGKFQVRFNLGAGENFLKWKVTNPSGVAKYYEPSEVTIIMEGCKLVNHKGTAEKIFDGANKTVCAWVQASEVTVYHKMDEEFLTVGDKVCYNPKVAPNWMVDGENVDKQEFAELVTVDRGVFLPL